MEYELGTVAVATVCGVPNVRVFMADPDSPMEWTSAGPVGSDRGLWHHDRDVTDVRPLVVLDLDGVGSHLLPSERNEGGVVAALRATQSVAAGRIADQIERQTKPRIEEPRGLGAVVETDGDVRYVRDPAGYWRSEDECRFWSDLTVLRVLSPGIEN